MNGKKSLLANLKNVHANLKSFCCEKIFHSKESEKIKIEGKKMLSVDQKKGKIINWGSVQFLNEFNLCEYFLKNAYTKMKSRLKNDKCAE